MMDSWIEFAHFFLIFLQIERKIAQDFTPMKPDNCMNEAGEGVGEGRNIIPSTTIQDHEILQNIS